MDRAKDPSPFAWIFGGALALVGLAAAASAIRKGNRAPTEDVWARPEPRRPAGTTGADPDAMLGAHPS